MARTKVVETRTHTLTVVGGKSYSIVVPVEFIRQLKWKERQQLNVTLEGKRLVITDRKK